MKDSSRAGRSTPNSPLQQQITRFSNVLKDSKADDDTDFDMMATMQVTKINREPIEMRPEYLVTQPQIDQVSASLESASDTQYQAYGGNSVSSICSSMRVAVNW